MQSDRELLTTMFHAAVAAADPAQAIRPYLPDAPKGRTVVIGAGKGAAQLGQAFEKMWPGDLSGLIVTRYGYGALCERLEVIEASHPVPDPAGEVAARRLMELVDGLTEDDLVVALISGGGSALLPAPPGELTLEDEIALNEALLASGAPISAMNAIRKQVSRIKGGRLAALAHPAKVVSLIVSDVPGDDPAEVASGPTVACARDRQSALSAIRDWQIELPERVMRHIETAEETAPNPVDPAFERDEVHVIASAARSLEAAAEVAAQAGVSPHILSDAIEGEAREVARVHAAIARECSTRARPFAAPAVILSGGETTVTIRSKGGRGGRNTEFLLSLAIELDGCPDVLALAADTDGIDGSEQNAGAFVNGNTAARLRETGTDARSYLGKNDAWSAFNSIEELFSPGPTGTNVNDFRAILVR